ncbi:MAG: hypothetical protein RIQ60_1953 [Pseudomonadota bacterium]|jgi:hypothetical protein
MRYSEKSNQSQTTYVATSKFKTANQWEITLIVYRAYTKNTFYEKHVLRKGESPQDVAAQRKKQGSQGNYFGVMGANTNHSTFVLLDRVEHKALVYALCKCILDNHLAGHLPAIGTYIDELPLQAVFDPAESVVTIHNGGAPTKCRSLKIGGTPIAVDGVNHQITYEISHSEGEGAT